MICRDTPTHGWVWVDGWVDRWVDLTPPIDPLNHPSTQPPIHPHIGGGVSTNHKSSNRIELSQLCQDLLNS